MTGRVARLAQDAIMSPADLLPALGGLAVTDTTTTPDLIAVAVASNAPTATCPACEHVADRAHSRYRRTLADLPVSGRRFIVRITARWFFCQHPGCGRRIFCERLPGLVDPHGRSTQRLAKLHRLIGFALGGDPGERLAEELAAPASGDTILRRVRAGSDEPGPAYRYVGIDDVALRKGHTYGTILIDLERGRVIDILDGRDGAAVEAWLKAHPGVEVITRDRWAAYANAAAAGAPRATQVADRWHLLKNLREAIERLFERSAGVIRVALAPNESAAPEPATPARRRPRSSRRVNPSLPPSEGRSRRGAVGGRSRTTAEFTNSTTRGCRPGRSPGSSGCPGTWSGGTCGPSSTPTGGRPGCDEPGWTGSPPTWTSASGTDAGTRLSCTGNWRAAGAGHPHAPSCGS